MAYVYVSTLIDDNVLRIKKTKEEESVLGRESTKQVVSK
jgi:hypothetical protein